MLTELDAVLFEDGKLTRAIVFWFFSLLRHYCCPLISRTVGTLNDGFSRSSSEQKSCISADVQRFAVPTVSSFKVLASSSAIFAVNSALTELMNAKIDIVADTELTRIRATMPSGILVLVVILPFSSIESFIGVPGAHVGRAPAVMKD